VVFVGNTDVADGLRYQFGQVVVFRLLTAVRPLAAEIPCLADVDRCSFYLLFVCYPINVLKVVLLITRSYFFWLRRNHALDRYFFDRGLDIDLRFLSYQGPRFLWDFQFSFGFFYHMWW
jgi:hypothetical protein